MLRRCLLDYLLALKNNNGLWQWASLFWPFWPIWNSLEPELFTSFIHVWYCLSAQLSWKTNTHPGPCLWCKLFLLPTLCEAVRHMVTHGNVCTQNVPPLSSNMSLPCEVLIIAIPWSQHSQREVWSLSGGSLIPTQPEGSSPLSMFGLTVNLTECKF